MSGARQRVAILLAVALGACGGEVGGAEVPRPWAEPPALALDLRAAVAPQQAALLQPVRVTLDLFHRAGVEVGFEPEVDDQQFAVDSMQHGEPVAFGDGYWRRTTLVLLPIDGPGECTVPEFRVETTGVDGQPLVATTAPMTITVTSLLDGEGAAIEAPGEPIPRPWSGWWWLGGGAAVLLLGIGAWLLRRGRRAPLRVPAEVALPPHVRALRELERLRSLPRTTPAEIEAFYVQTSQALRVYLEQRFHLHAPERTTEEFLRDLEQGDQLAQRHRGELERFLCQCDLVKFAAVRPGAGEHDTVWQLAFDFVEATRADRVTGAVA